MIEFIRYAAKAVAGYVVPWVVLGVGWLTIQTGVDIPVNEEVALGFFTSLFTAVGVYLTRNARKPVTPGTSYYDRPVDFDVDDMPLRDAGESPVNLLAIIVIVALCVLGLYYLFNSGR